MSTDAAELPAPSGASPTLTASPALTTSAGRLAGLHLRLGSLLIARSELERLHGLGALDSSALADLAEARWRTGDLASAAEAAHEHLEGGGIQPITLVIAAESAAAGGRPDEARTHLGALGDLPAADLVELFAGMPQRAFWPFAPAVTAGPTVLPEAAPTPPPTRRPRDEEAATPGREQPAAEAVEAGRPRLWDDGVLGGPEAAQPSESVDIEGVPAGSDPLEAAGRDLAASDAERQERGITRVALILRGDPTRAGQILELLARRPEPAALVTRGDAFRILGRALEAEAAYGAAAAALAGRARRTGRLARGSRRPPA